MVPVSVMVGAGLGGIYSYLTVALFFVVLPVLDLLFPANRNLNEPIELSYDWNFRIVPILYAFVQIALVIWGGFWVSSQELSTLELVGVTLSVGVSTGGVGITVAHELFHKHNTFEKMLGHALLLIANYMHFSIEHRVGHHTHVATFRDPSTARFRESIYSFLPRTLFGGYRSAWRLETNRLKKSGRNAWNFSNQMIWFALLPVLFSIFLWQVFGPIALIYFYAQALVGAIILETVNYVEHYGLERREVSPGKYESVKPIHSWNANCLVSNYLFFKLQRHSDHHIHPTKRYHTLEYDNLSPELPTGYAGMALLALIPPLWKRVMDPAVLQLKSSGSAFNH